MSAIVLDGTQIAAQIKSEVGEEVKELAAAGLRPGLAVVLARHNPASEIYVRNKVKSCEQLGIYSEKHTPPEKDVDGFHPMNVGYLSTQRPGLVPCTPAGIVEILKRSGIAIAGAEAVV